MIINPSRQLIFDEVYCPYCVEGRITQQQSVELNYSLREDGDFAYATCNNCNKAYA